MLLQTSFTEPFLSIIHAYKQEELQRERESVTWYLQQSWDQKVWLKKPFFSEEVLALYLVSDVLVWLIAWNL